MLLDICDTTRTLITQFPSDGTVESFLKENGLYPSTTYLYLRSQHRDTIFPEFEDKTGGLEQPAILNTSQLHVVPGAGKRVVCSVCSCTYVEGGECIRCQQDREYEASRIADGGSPIFTTENLVPISIDDVGE